MECNRIYFAKGPDSAHSLAQFFGIDFVIRVCARRRYIVLVKFMAGTLRWLLHENEIANFRKIWIEYR